MNNKMSTEESWLYLRMIIRDALYAAHGMDIVAVRYHLHEAIDYLNTKNLREPKNGT